jgi:hypothetical protein
MLLKWLFTMLAIIWLYQAIRPFFVSAPQPRQNIKQSDNTKTKRRDDDEGDYIDYEEIK